MTKLKYQRRFAVIFIVLSLLEIVHPLALRELEKDYENKEKVLSHQKQKEDDKELLFGKDELIKMERERFEFGKDEKKDGDHESTALVEYHGGKEKRVTWVVAASRILFAASIISMGVGLGVDIWMYIEKCCDHWDVCDNAKKFEDTYEKLNDTTIMTDIYYTNAENTYTQALALNTLTEELWLRVLYFDEWAEKFLEAIDTDIMAVFNNKSAEISRGIAEKNLTISSYADIEWEFISVFDQLNGTLMRLAGVALLGIFGLGYGTYTYFKKKNAKKIANVDTPELPSKPSIGLADASKMINNMNAAKKTTGFKAWVTRNTPYFKLAANAIFTALVIAMDVWMMYQTFKQCDDLTNSTKIALELIEKEYADSLVLYGNATDLYDNATGVYQQVQDMLTSDDVVDFTWEVYWTAGNASNQTDSLVEAQAHLLYYLNNVNTFKNSEDKRSDFYDMIQRLSYGYQNVTFKTYCLSRKQSSLTYGVSECILGSDTISNLFAKVQLQYIADLEECVENGYVTEDSFTTYVLGEVADGGYQTDCILNNADKQTTVCSKWLLDELPDTTNCAALGLTDTQCDWFLQNCPPGDLSDQQKDAICTQWQIDTSLEDVKKTYYKYDQEQVETTYNTCPPIELTTADYDLICVYKGQPKTEEEVLTIYSKYNATLVSDTYNDCNMSSSDSGMVCLFKTMGHSPDASPQFYTNYNAAYGSDKVNQTYWEYCPEAATGDFTSNEDSSNTAWKRYYNHDEMKQIIPEDLHHRLNDDMAYHDIADLFDEVINRQES